MRLETTLTLLIGVPGSGKSYWLQRYLDRIYEPLFEKRDKEGKVRAPYLHILDPTEGIDGAADHQAEHLPTAATLRIYDNVDDLAFYAAKYGGIVVVEEANSLRPSEHAIIRPLVTRRRHFKLQIIATTQRPKWLPRELVTLVDEWRVFRLYDPDDIKAIRHIVRAYEANLSTFPIGDHIHFKNGVSRYALATEINET